LDKVEIEELNVPQAQNDVEVTAAKVFSGKQVPPEQHIFLYSADDWEIFLREWAQYQKTKYHKVSKLGGANDYGVDIAGFTSDQGFEGEWDNYQCKYYKGNALAPGTAIPEIGKLLWNVYSGHISLPRKYYFFAPKDCGPSLQKLLLSPSKLKSKLFEQWADWCADSITTTMTIELAGKFSEFADSVNFSMFEYKPTGEVIEEHRKTPFFYSRFGGGLPDRPASELPPEAPLEKESRYISQLFEAYSDKENCNVNAGNIAGNSSLNGHFGRQREAFFHAESLKAFARDTVPHGTFSALQDEVHSGVIDTSEGDHSNGFERVNAVTQMANAISLSANGLIQVTKLQDRRGICHQLANVNRLTWVPKDE